MTGLFRSLSRFLKAAFAAWMLAALLLPCAARATDFPPYAKVIGIAVLGPLSGPDKQLGLDLSAGVEAAVDDANATRGLTDFGWVMHSFDDQGDPGIAQQQAQFALVDTNTLFVIGHIGGQETLLALPVYHEQDVPVIIPTNGLAALTQQGYDDVFRMCPTDTVEGQLDARYVDRVIKPSNIAVVWEETDYGADTATGFVNYAGGGAKLKAGDYPVDVDLKKMKDVVTRVAAAAPDFIYLTGKGSDMAKVLKALRAAGVTAPVLGSGAFYSDSLLQSLGADAAGMLVSTCVPPVSLMPEAQAFQRRYEERHGKLSAFALYGYAAAQVAIKAALQTRSTDKRLLLRELDTGLFSTVVGNVGFRTGGDPAEPNLYFYRYDGSALKYSTSAFPNPSILR
jgi:branched-chain amino acid transport system substrate-binding protein